MNKLADKYDGINRKTMQNFLKDFFTYNIKYNVNNKNPIKIERDGANFKVEASYLVKTEIFHLYFNCYLYSRNWDMYVADTDHNGSKKSAYLLNLFTLSSIYLPYAQRTNYQLF